ncbi:MAG: tetratricopeptide repeat protein [Desulfobulbaceae bacterium]|nr:tetratricopeptide repeat protein [Desulfobulbaceae bacterium]
MIVQIRKKREVLGSEKTRKVAPSLTGSLCNGVEEVAAPLSLRWQKVVLSLVIVLLGVMVYANSFPGDFFVDDVHLVAENPLVIDIDLSTIFTTDYWGSRVNKSGLFRPLTILSFGANRWLLGPEPWSYHVVNVCLHALVGLVFFQLLLRWRFGMIRSFFAAALFAVHPIHTEVVNEAVGRSELFVALFFLLALQLAESEKAYVHTIAGACFALALLSKEHAITFLAALFLVDVFFRRGLRKRLALHAAMLIIVAVWLLYREFGLHYGPPDPFRNSLLENILYQPLAFMSTTVRVLTALKIQLLYLGKLFWPSGLQGVYSGPAVGSPLTTLVSVWGALIVATGLAGMSLALYGFRRRQLYGLAIVLYAVCFTVTSNIFFASGVIMAERAAYLPSLWFCMGVAGFLPNGDFFLKRNRQLAGIAICVVLLLASGGTWFRNKEYSSQESLWTADFGRDPQNILAGIFLIDVYVQRQDYARAEEICREIMVYHPALIENLETLAWLLVREGKPQEALGYAMQAFAEVEKGKEHLSDKLVTTLVEINVLLRQPREVLKWLDHIPREGQLGYYWELKGKAHEELGEMRLAVDAYRRVGEPPPGSEVPYSLERLLLKLGEIEEAQQVQQWIKAREAAQGFVPQ